MRSPRLGQGVRLAVAVGTALAFVCSCAGGTQQATGGTARSEPASGGTIFGPSQPLGNGAAKTYVTLDAAERPTEVGVRLSATALDNLPQDAGPAQATMLAFPDRRPHPVQPRHAELEPAGARPGRLFGRPHFDVHFDMVPMGAMQAISPSDRQFTAKAQHLPDPKYIPQGYVVPPGSSAATQAVPGMGVHLVDGSDSTLVPGKYNFQQIIINGVWDGRYTFIEPMITRERLLTQPDVQGNLKQPQAYQMTAFYPTTYGIHVDPQTKDYLIALTGLTSRRAS